MFGVSGVTGFVPADEPLELPDDDGPVFTREQREAATAGSQVKRGTTDPLDLPKTQRMLMGIVNDAIRRRDLTQEEVCRLTGLSPAYISQLLNGRRTGTFAVWDMLLDIARFDFNGFGSFRPPDLRARPGRKPRVRHEDE
jgi:predicted XRE-type DNA-binding protein